MSPRRRSGAGRRRGDAAGVVSRVHVENFMCHSNMTIDLSDNVNFITGQNGSGKSAILTALCVAFGIRARGTQRASAMKDFIKTGCSYALVAVQLKNEGPDAYRPEVFGRSIVIERRITLTTSTIVLKDEQGRKIATKKDDLNEMVDHFNIDVENPCVVMSQDKSREFLHSGNDKEKFKFFYKATLLQQVSELLETNGKNIQASEGYLKENEETFRPFEVELSKLDQEIKRAERVDEMAQEVANLRKKLAWSLVYEIDAAIAGENQRLKKLEERVPKCQEKIDMNRALLAEKQEACTTKNASLADLFARSEQAREKQNQLFAELSEIAREKASVEENLQAKLRMLETKRSRRRNLEQHARDMQVNFQRSTQAEESERDEAMRALHEEIDREKTEMQSLQQEESELNVKINAVTNDIMDMTRELDDRRTKLNDLQGYLRRLQNQQSNKLSAFGGDPVMRLIRRIEDQQHHFSKPPLGPIGAHLALAGDDGWALAVEVALGKFLNAFVVTNHRDMLFLRKLARECQYGNLFIVIYDFEHPELHLPEEMLPDRRLVTVLSVLKTESVIIRNVLIDQGGVERQVLVQDFDEGRSVVFERRAMHVKEAFTKDGLRMFARAGSETTLPKDRNIRSGRLDAGIDQRISLAELEISQVKDEIRRFDSEKRRTEEAVKQLRSDGGKIKAKLSEKHKFMGRNEIRFRDMKRQAEQAATAAVPNTEELEHEIQDAQAEEAKMERVIQELRNNVADAESRHKRAKTSHDSHCESTKDDAEALRNAGDFLQSLEEDINSAKSAVDHFTQIMNGRVLPEIRQQKEKLTELEQNRMESSEKASQICPEEELRSIGGVTGNTMQLDAEIRHLQNRVNTEKRNVTPIEQLLKNKLRVEKKIFKKKNLHTQLKRKIEMMSSIYKKRRALFEKNCNYLKRQMLWQFNNHLKKKGFSGHLKIDYEAKTLKLEIRMPQDASNSAVKDTRALSGGERSFSTLCFALALHEMTEAPFRAMDEFDVFMDQISRKISLDAVVDFAVEQGSQWIFITPHDISMVKSTPKVKRLQMMAPRPS